MKLTQKVVDRLTLPTGRADFIAWDDELVGFGIRLRQGGRRSWIVQYRFGHTQRRVSLGTPATLKVEQARAAARTILAQVHLGRDPQAERGEAKLRAANTLGAVVRQYLDQGRSRWRPRSYAEISRHLLKRWTPLHSAAVDAITRAHVATRIGEISRQHGGVAANRARSALSACFVWAAREGLATANPVVATNKAAAEKPRDRVVADDELITIWNACEGIGDFGHIVRLLLLLGQRREEVGSMTVAELDLEKRLWLIPGSRTKNQRAHIVPLSDQAIAIIRQVWDGTRTGYVFGRRLGKPFQNWSGARKGLDERIAASRPTTNKSAPPRWHLHDLRRTAAVGMQRLGVRVEIIEQVLNHRSGTFRGIVGVYQVHDYLPERRRALDMWAAHVAGLVAGKPGANVVPIRNAL